MSYKLNKTDGTLLVDLVDGSLDTTTTSIGLIGKNYSGFGETLNENQIKMLENFANTSAPSVPLIGQLWYDKSQGRIKVYDGTTFRESGGPIVSTSFTFITCYIYVRKKMHFISYNTISFTSFTSTAFNIK